MFQDVISTDAPLRIEMIKFTSTSTKFTEQPLNKGVFTDGSDLFHFHLTSTYSVMEIPSNIVGNAFYDWKKGLLRLVEGIPYRV